MGLTRDPDPLEVVPWHEEPPDPRDGARAFAWILLALVAGIVVAVWWFHPWTQ